MIQLHEDKALWNVDECCKTLREAARGEQQRLLDIRYIGRAAGAPPSQADRPCDAGRSSTLNTGGKGLKQCDMLAGTHERAAAAWRYLRWCRALRFLCVLQQFARHG